MASVHLTGAATFALSDDKQTVMIIFTVAGESGADEKFSITLQVDQVKWLRSLAHDIVLAVERAVHPMNSVVLHYPQRYDIGSSEQLKGQVAVTFDKDTPAEVIYVMPNLAGLQFADAIKADIMPRLTQQERSQMMALIKPKRPGIVIPR